jgi:hypothetical protein
MKYDCCSDDKHYRLTAQNVCCVENNQLYDFYSALAL